MIEKEQVENIIEHGYIGNKPGRPPGTKNGQGKYYRNGKKTPLAEMMDELDNVGRQHTEKSATVGNPSDSFINSMKGLKSNSLSKEDKKIQKALEKSMKKAVKEKKEVEAEEAKKKAEEAKKKAEEAKKKLEESKKEEPKKEESKKEESKKEEPKKEESKKEEPKKEEPKKSEDNNSDKDNYDSRKSDYDKRKQEFDLAKTERELKDAKTAEANKPYNDNLDRQIKDLKTGAELSKQASIGSTYASKAAKEIGKVDNSKRMKTELEAMSNAEIAKINERLALENRYKDLNKDRMSKGYTAVHNFFNIAAPVLGLLGSSLTVAAQIKELKKK